MRRPVKWEISSSATSQGWIIGIAMVGVIYGLFSYSSSDHQDPHKLQAVIGALVAFLVTIILVAGITMKNLREQSERLPDQD